MKKKPKTLNFAYLLENRIGKTTSIIRLKFSLLFLLINIRPSIFLLLLLRPEKGNDESVFSILRILLVQMSAWSFCFVLPMKYWIIYEDLSESWGFIIILFDENNLHARMRSCWSKMTSSTTTKTKKKKKKNNFNDCNDIL